MDSFSYLSSLGIYLAPALSLTDCSVAVSQLVIPFDQPQGTLCPCGPVSAWPHMGRGLQPGPESFGSSGPLLPRSAALWM